jgi:hypothetical protein
VIVTELSISADGKIAGVWPYPPEQEIPNEHRRRYQALLAAAKDAARQLKYRPYKIDGKAMDLQATVVFRFDPDSGTVSFTPEDENPRLLFRSEQPPTESAQNTRPSR